MRGVENKIYKYTYTALSSRKFNNSSKIIGRFSEKASRTLGLISILYIEKGCRLSPQIRLLRDYQHQEDVCVCRPGEELLMKTRINECRDVDDSKKISSDLWSCGSI